MPGKSSKSIKIQITTDRFTHHVLNNLVDIKGTSVADVANFILKDWIGDHLEELEKYNITAERKNGQFIL